VLKISAALEDSRVRREETVHFDLWVLEVFLCLFSDSGVKRVFLVNEWLSNLFVAPQTSSEFVSPIGD